jgi:hypothetical protein
MNIKNGVAKNPPPIPNIPARKPAPSPSNNTKSIFTGISAMGK